jgi:hypothetical protein
MFVNGGIGSSDAVGAMIGGSAALTGSSQVPITGFHHRFPSQVPITGSHHRVRSLGITSIPRCVTGCVTGLTPDEGSGNA